MTSLALANLDFEEELACRVHYRRAPAMESLLERWRYLLRLLPGMKAATCLQSPHEPLALLSPVSRLCVWGVTASSRHLAQQLGLESQFPPLSAVREVNGKLFSHQLEQSLGVALPFARPIESLSELQNAVKDCPHDWVLKHPLGFSARERAVGKAGTVSESSFGWAKRRLNAGWTLLFEPWLQDKTEYSFHFDIGADRTVNYLGHTELLVDAGGVYRGTSVDPTLEPPDGYLAVVYQAVAQVAARGYWGPVGVDAMRGALGSRRCERPLTEINARLSFGRMALELGRHLPATWAYRWHHPKAGREKREWSPLPDSPGAGVYALPETVDPGGETGTYLLTAPDRSALLQLESSLTEL